MTEEVVHGRMQARVAHGQQHQRRIARQSQEIAEEDEDEEDLLQRGPVGETQQEEVLFCAMVALKEGNCQNVCKVTAENSRMWEDIGGRWRGVARNKCIVNLSLWSH